MKIHFLITLFSPAHGDESKKMVGHVSGGGDVALVSAILLFSMVVYIWILTISDYCFLLFFFPSFLFLIFAISLLRLGGFTLPCYYSIVFAVCVITASFLLLLQRGFVFLLLKYIQQKKYKQMMM